MIHPPSQLTKQVLHTFIIVATDDLLRVRGPWLAYPLALGMFLLGVLLLWVMIQVGLLYDGALTVMTPMLAAGFLLFLFLWARWWTFDRKADSVRYVPWRRCRISEIRGVCVRDRRVFAKRTSYLVQAIDLERDGKPPVRLGGMLSAIWDRKVALDLARIMGAWLKVPVSEEVEAKGS